MNVAALRHAGLTGLANRGMQAFARAIDRFAVNAGQPRFEHLRPSAVADPGRDPARFFAGACADPTPFIDATTRTRLLTSAEAVLVGRFDLLGYSGLSFGDPIDWHVDPVTGRRAPLTHWSLIDPLDHDAVGDHKVTWELNRHQWLVDLAHAWRLTGDARYADAVCAHLDHWMADNPPGMGINWASSLEASYRAISWCWLLHLLDDAAAFTADRRARVVAWLRAHALHVERYLSYYYSPNTHLTGEALGLFCVGVTLRSSPGARRWRQVGASILDAEIMRQVRPDGIYFEQAACYQRYTAEIYLHYLLLAARNGVEVPGRVVERVQALLDALLWFTGPDGRLLRTGDDDGGTLLGGRGRTTDDPRGVFAIAAAWFGRADYAWAARGFQPEVFWFLGAVGVAAFDRLAPAPPATAPARAFRAGGHVVMRSDWSDTSHQVTFDAGPLGCPVSGGHGHADLLAIQCHVFGRPLVVDPGTGSYAPVPGWRDWFRSTAAHSTVVVDARPQAETDGPFRWRARPAAHIDAWQAGDRYDLVEGSHEAYGAADDPVTHRRRVLFVREPGFWIVIDDFVGDGHRAASCLQFAPEVRVGAPDADGALVARLHTGERVVIRTLAAGPVRTRIEERWFSPAYGKRTRAPAAVFEWNTRRVPRALTLFLPGDLTLDGWRHEGGVHEVEVDGMCFRIGDSITVTKEG